jgi:hypothetical protein
VRGTDVLVELHLALELGATRRAPDGLCFRVRVVDVLV